MMEWLLETLIEIFFGHSQHTDTSNFFEMGKEMLS